jgi:hypothetical protein
MGTRPAARLLAVLGTLALVAMSGPAQGQAVSVDALLARMLTEANPQPYTMTADFTTTTVLQLPTGRVTVNAAGTFVESRTAAGEPRRRRVSIARLDIPLLLRPFSGFIRRLITDLIEAEQKPGDYLPQQDVFIVEERPPDRYLVGGVRADIVTEVMTRYGQAAAVRDPATRRAIARWLWSPSQRAYIVRPGPGPYMITALVDEGGLIHQLGLLYDWGQVGNRISFLMVGGRPFWSEVVSDTSFDMGGMGRVDGRMVLQVQNHCFNCPPR